VPNSRDLRPSGFARLAEYNSYNACARLCDRLCLHIFLPVEKTIGQIAAAAMRKMIAPSQVANISTAIGIQASGLTMRRI
jgi:hypothetical protein